MTAVTHASSVRQPNLDSASSPENGERLSVLLRRAREARNLTLQQVANETKIPLRRLEAIENNRVPLGVEDFYLRAEIRAYARAVHYDEHLALAWLHQHAPVSPAPTVVEPAVAVRRSTSPATRLTILLGVLGATAVFGMAMGSTARLLVPGRLENPAATSSPRLAATPAIATAQSVADTARAESHPPSRPSPDDTSGAARSAQVLDKPSIVHNDAAVTPTNTRAAIASIDQLLVVTEPEGARVTVNGVGWGSAPVTIRHLSPGAKRIRVTKDGYKPEERVIQLAEGEPRRLDVRLTRIQ